MLNVVLGGATLVALLLTDAVALSAQTPAPPVSVEVQLAQAQKVILQLRKDKAAAEWQAAEALERVLKCEESTKPPVPAPAAPGGK
jgi:hypothetical protein